MIITTAFLIGSIAALVMGIIVGWYVTRQHYRRGIIEREAINGYINHQKTKNPPPTRIERCTGSDGHVAMYRDTLSY